MCPRAEPLRSFRMTKTTLTDVSVSLLCTQVLQGAASAFGGGPTVSYGAQQGTRVGCAGGEGEDAARVGRAREARGCTGLRRRAKRAVVAVGAQHGAAAGDMAARQWQPTAGPTGENDRGDRVVGSRFLFRNGCLHSLRRPFFLRGALRASALRARALHAQGAHVRLS